MMKTGSSGMRCNAAALLKLADSLARLADPILQGLQLLSVFVAGLVVGDDGGGNGRERKSFGGRISISGGLGQFTGGGSVVQADKATEDSASSIGLDGDINGYLLDEGVALFSDDLNAIDVLGDNLDGGLRLPGLQLGLGLLLCGRGGIPLRLNVIRALEPTEAEYSDAKRRQGQQPVWPGDEVHGAASPMHCRYSASRRVTRPPHSRALVSCAQSLP